MKNQARVWIASALIGSAGLAMAQERAPEAPAKPAAAPKPAAKPAPKPAPKRLGILGTLVAFDTEKAMITFTDEAGKSFTWPVEARLAENAQAYAQQRLQTLKEGDPVRITYVMEAGGPRVYDVRPGQRAQAGSDN